MDSPSKTFDVMPLQLVGYAVAPHRIYRPVLDVVIQTTIRVASNPAEGSPAYLTNLLRSWVEAGCRWDKWQESNPDPAKKLQYVPHFALDNWRVRIDARKKDGRPEPFVLGDSGFGPDGPEKANEDESQAYALFGTFIVAAGPHADIRICRRCGDFFWNGRGYSARRFCSRTCTSRELANESHLRRQSAARQKINAKIKQAIKDFLARKPETDDWRRWVAGRARISRHAVTGALNRGERGEPDGLVLPKKQREFFRRLEDREGEKQEAQGVGGPVAKSELPSEIGAERTSRGVLYPGGFVGSSPKVVGPGRAGFKKGGKKND
jgi:hypothetical protein